jgi:arylsulfatase A-like enzyme
MGRRPHQGTREQRSLVVLAWLVASLLPACSFGSSDPREDARATRRPNVLIVVVDDQRIGTMSAMPETLSRFGRNGTAFTQAFATTPLCCPSRASIFTGRYAHNHGVKRNGESDSLDDATTLQAYMQAAGYRTALFGKYLIGSPVERDPPHFDKWAIFPTSRGSYLGGEWNVNGEVATIDRYGTRYISNQAARFLNTSESVDAQPWLMYVATGAPHAPRTAETRYAGAPVGQLRSDPAIRERDRHDKPSFVRRKSADADQMRKVHRQQLRTLRSVDDLIDRMFTLMTRLREERNTLAFFVSDNGYLLGEHGLYQKRYPYTRSVSIPFFVRWPGHFGRAVTDRRLVANIDIAPTVLRAAGVSPPDDPPMDGRSLLEQDGRDRMLIEFWNELGVPTWASIRKNGYQYIEYYRDDGSIFFREYYDMRSDPWQLTNLFRDGDRSNDPSRRQLHLRLERDRSCEGSACP